MSKGKKGDDIFKVLDKAESLQYNQSMDMYKGRLFYGFQYKVNDDFHNVWIFPDGTYHTEPFTNFMAELTYVKNQISPDVLKKIMEKKPLKVDGQLLFQEITEFLKSFVELQSEIEYQMVALWIFHTYLKKPFGVTPYLHFNGQANSGKSTIMRFAMNLAFKGMVIVKPNPPILYRMLDANMCSFGLDEFEQYTDAEKNETFSILNSGYAYGDTVPRCVKNGGGNFDVEFYSTFGAKTFASITDTRMKSFSSRSIEMYLLRTTRVLKDIVHLFDEDVDKFARLRDALYLFHLQNYDSILSTYRSIKEVKDLKARTLQIVKPLLPYARQFGIEEELLKHYIDTKNRVIDDGIDYDRDYLMLEMLKDLIKEGTRQVSIKDLGDKYRERIKDRTSCADNFLPNNRSVGWLMRRYGFDKERTNNGTWYLIDPNKLCDRAERYDYGKYIDMNDIDPQALGKAKEEMIEDG